MEDDRNYYDLPLFKLVYHGKISNEEGVTRLENFNKDGGYLIRDSEREPDCYVLAVFCNGKVRNYRIGSEKGKFYLKLEARNAKMCGVEFTRFHTLQRLADYCVDHGKNAGLICSLTQPCQSGFIDARRDGRSVSDCSGLKKSPSSENKTESRAAEEDNDSQPSSAAGTPPSRRRGGQMGKASSCENVSGVPCENREIPHKESIRHGGVFKGLLQKIGKSKSDGQPAKDSEKNLKRRAKKEGEITNYKFYVGLEEAEERASPDKHDTEEDIADVTEKLRAKFSELDTEVNDNDDSKLTEELAHTDFERVGCEQKNKTTAHVLDTRVKSDSECDFGALSPKGAESSDSTKDTAAAVSVSVPSPSVAPDGDSKRIGQGVLGDIRKNEGVVNLIRRVNERLPNAGTPAVRTAGAVNRLELQKGPSEEETERQSRTLENCNQPEQAKDRTSMINIQKTSTM